MEENKKGWVSLQKYIDPQRTPTKEPTLCAFRGGKQQLRRTTFMILVGALTSGNEKLVRSIDYVKGVLVHDPLDVLQEIITARIPSTDLNKELTQKLTIVGIFLKNQFQHHVA